ncbi:IclR family transcriptional regulator [Variovorax sp. PBL-E5]|uniref:IclR family transcriptional regulator n=1 Tax=Variovorax sp. PBL-E5 TaxID=434014 RepID=UPI001318CDBA|nr:IclR family transcriptional regulator [Variovorax sp. PBL-E5]VTU45402.1 Pca regulon regulatory protein [Variovorax sp. PBL-E5]
MFATSLANGLLILKSFKVGEPALANREFVERTGLSKATVSRLTYTLGELGFLRYDAEQRRYRLGSATLAAGYPLLASLTIRQVARPFMKALADHARGSVSLGMRDRSHMVYIETCRGHEAIAFRPDIGGSLPLLTTAMGRAWLGGTSDELRRQALQQIQAEDPGAWKKHRGAVQASLRSLEATGACVARGDWQQDVHAVAVPMQRVVDGETLVFNCGVPAVLLGRRTLETDVGPRLVRMVRDVERAYLAQQRTAY